MIPLQIQMEIEKLLNELSSVQAMIDINRIDQEETIKKSVPPEILQLIEEIREEFGQKEAAANDRAREIEQEIKNLVAQAGKSVSGDFLQAVYSKPRVTWDSKLLEGFAIAHPEIERAKKIGNPTVSIRRK